jgi:hypothetical protein
MNDRNDRLDYFITRLLHYLLFVEDEIVDAIRHAKIDLEAMDRANVKNGEHTTPLMRL